MNIGKKIYGFCNGYFGRDDYDTKIIIFETDTAIVCAYLDSDYVSVANFESKSEKQQYIDKWSTELEEW